MAILKTKGLGTVKEGISRCSSDNNLYEIRSLPRKSPVNESFLSQQAQLEHELLMKLHRSRKAQFIRRGLRNAIFILVAPIYYGLYRFPRWMAISYVQPVIRQVTALIQKVKARLNALDAYINKRIEAFHNRVTEAFAKGKKAIVSFFSTILRPVDILIEKVSQPIRTISEKVQSYFLRVRALPAKAGQIVQKAQHRTVEKAKEVYPENLTNAVKIVSAYPDKVKQFAWERHQKLWQWILQRPEPKPEMFPVYGPSLIRRGLNYIEKIIIKSALGAWGKAFPYIDRYTYPVRRVLRIADGYLNRGLQRVERSTEAAYSYVCRGIVKISKLVKSGLKVVLEPIGKRVRVPTAKLERFRIQLLKGYRKVGRVFSARVEWMKRRLEHYRDFVLHLCDMPRVVGVGVVRFIVRRSIPIGRGLQILREEAINRTRIPRAYVRVLPKCFLQIVQEAFLDFSF